MHTFPFYEPCNYLFVTKVSDTGRSQSIYSGFQYFKPSIRSLQETFIQGPKMHRCLPTQQGERKLLLSVGKFYYLSIKPERLFQKGALKCTRAYTTCKVNTLRSVMGTGHQQYMWQGRPEQVRKNSFAYL